MATDIAEFIGAAIGLNLLFGVPLLIAGLITGATTFLLLELHRRGYRLVTVPQLIADDPPSRHQAPPPGIGRAQITSTAAARRPPRARHR